MIYRTTSPEETKRLGETLGKQRKGKGGLICFFGDLGSGKTTFTKGIARGMGIGEEEIRSPTFTMIHPYELQGGQRLYHCDLYRMADSDAIILSLEELWCEKNALVILEWAERVKKILPKPRIDIQCEVSGEHHRTITITSIPHAKETVRSRH